MKTRNMESWTSMMKATSQMDSVARMVAAVLLGTWLIVFGLSFEAEYPKELIVMAGQPWWRLLMVIAAVAAAYWCPRVGVLAALAVVVYLADLRALTTA